MMRRVADAVLAALLAPPCAVCARVLEHPLDGAVCEHCWNAITCLALPAHGTPVIRHAAAVGEYEGVLREIIHALKYKGRRSIAPRLARLMALHGSQVLAHADAVVPVPLHPDRQRERGFNQADDLARGLGLPVAPLLRRTRMTPPQVELPATARHANVRGAFEVIGGSVDRPEEFVRRGRSLQRPDIAGRIFVLVDDVTTTGATLEACAHALKQAGAKDVRALTAARVRPALR